MQPLTVINSTAISLPEPNIDTDIIYPARFLTDTRKIGLGEYAFYDRCANDPNFPIHRRIKQEILITGENFGSGSSREQAPWSLADLGLRVLIAPSFGDIFYGNCFRNGLLPIRLPSSVINELHQFAKKQVVFEINLIDCEIKLNVENRSVQFEVPSDGRESLLNGWNETTRILENYTNDIIAFEQKQRSDQPWLWK
ncbi:3-isopropylmalate dehydratase small subunit [Hirschia baltica]|uniref:3-isopropylmalate dehydratase n=1 Tax=Hirschia baltica (strain ATCC 49814 / DSM 5838 / IFAM 1418) TaxID=582402 RepID=C6XJ98_HIRBI|nr:3-isopropylmalate dehydratase small subunit [Hirschia baltica]ACT59193.1 3-isopropylmalate dehydratase, small subunit [Hirschia baltica ATCC 49814]